MKSEFRGDFQLENFQFIILKFNNGIASGTDHVIVVLAQMHVFITDMTIFKPVLLCKSEPAHQFERFQNKVGGQGVPALFGQGNQFSNRHMMFGIQKDLEHFQPVIKMIHGFLFKELFELFLFLTVKLYHFNISPDFKQIQ
jgi:hypothetical protein